MEFLEPVISKYSALRATIRGKSVLVLGSSREPIASNPAEFDIVITANE